MKDLAGRTAFVTGGANGVGIGLVRQLLNEGCKVAIADIRQDSIDKALASLDNREVMGVQLDVASRDGFKAAADEVEAKFGPVSILCNNAGVNLFQPIEESSFDDWDWLLGVNLHGVINGVMTFVPRMVARVKAGEQKGGYVVNTASMAAFLAAGTPGIYNTTKFAVRGLSESLHYSLLQYEIGVSVLCPGLVKSYIYASDDIRPDELKGQALVVFVTVKTGITPSDALKEELRNHVGKEIGAIAKPDTVRFAASLPKTRSGKIMRRILKEIAGGGEVKGDTTTLEDFSVVAALQTDE